MKLIDGESKEKGNVGDDDKKGDEGRVFYIIEKGEK